MLQKKNPIPGSRFFVSVRRSPETARFFLVFLRNESGKSLSGLNFISNQGIAVPDKKPSVVDHRVRPVLSSAQFHLGL